MKSLNKRLWSAAAAFFVILSIPTPSRAESDQVDIRFHQGQALVPSAQTIATERLASEHLKLVKDSNVVLLAYAMWMESACIVDVGFARLSRGRMPGVPYQKGWAISSQRAGESRDDTCARTFAKAIDYLRDGTDIPAIVAKTAASDVPDAKARMPRNLPASKTIVYSYTSGLNSETESSMADLVGSRFLQTFDYRKFAVYVDLMPFKTEEGREGCMVRTGLTARSTDGSRHRLPFYLYTRYLERQPEAPRCPREMIKAALSDMASDALSGETYKSFRDVAEPGVKYPTRKELLATRAAFDRREAQLHRELEMKERKAVAAQARTVSTNVLRCTNECFNGSCVRTFENGRKERWQAPRVFRFGNWEWDTTTNACGR
jgi:hypothetical protein